MVFQELFWKLSFAACFSSLLSEAKNVEILSTFSNVQRQTIKYDNFSYWISYNLFVFLIQFNFLQLGFNRLSSYTYAMNLSKNELMVTTR